MLSLRLLLFPTLFTCLYFYFKYLSAASWVGVISVAVSSAIDELLKASCGKQQVVRAMSSADVG